MGFMHVVMFAFEPLATAEEIRGVCERMLALKDNCVRPQTSTPYIKTGTGGKDNSPESHQNGFSHIFISEFENEDDRTYYIREDPAHQAFIKSIAGVVSKVQVNDFTPGDF